MIKLKFPENRKREGRKPELHKERVLLFESRFGKMANKKLAKKCPNRHKKGNEYFYPIVRF